ncbi:MAG: heavy-metal-associated domain-containing protein [Eubacterium sp.]
MYKTIMDVEGMMCGNCEKHMNEMIQKKFDVKEVISSYKKAETQIISEEKLEEDKLRGEVKKIGYKVIEIEVEPYEKKKFSLFHK